MCVFVGSAPIEQTPFFDANPLARRVHFPSGPRKSGIPKNMVIVSDVKKVLTLMERKTCVVLLTFSKKVANY